MTFLEKLLENYPDAVIEDVIEFECPGNYGYEKEIECKVEKNEYICKRCWEREMPSSELEEDEKTFKEDKKHVMPKEEYQKLSERLEDLETLQQPFEVCTFLSHNGKASYQCKNCGNELVVNAFNGEYCHWCGQRLKWRNEDAE